MCIRGRIRKTSGKCIYVEAEFHDSVEGAEWIIENVEEIGEAICRGICKGADIAYVPENYESEEEKAKRWAVETGLIRGYKDGSYGWDDALTREQLAIIEYRKAKGNSENNG